VTELCINLLVDLSYARLIRESERRVGKEKSSQKKMITVHRPRWEKVKAIDGRLLKKKRIKKTIPPRAPKTSKPKKDAGKRGAPRHGL